MRTTYEEEDWKVCVVDHGAQIDLRDRPMMAAQQVMPVACYIKPDGAIDDQPSLCFIIRMPNGIEAAAQLSARMFTPVIMELERIKNENLVRQTLPTAASHGASVQ